MLRKFLASLAIIFSLNGHCQDGDLGSWNILNIKYTISNRWSAFGEVQLRSLKFYDHFHYYQYKTGINYKLADNAILSLGGGSYQTYKEGGDFVLPKNNDEFRIWPQIVFLQSLSAIKIEQRYRTDFRFTSNGFRNRFRYRLGLAYPFGTERMNFKPFGVSASNELFFTSREPYFERTRFLFSFHYKPSKTTMLQIGYLFQFDYRINDETGRDFLQIGLFIDVIRDKPL
jgi:hypothetical protein